jgi:hypothetical protein
MREFSGLESASPDLNVQPWLDRAKEGVGLARMGLVAPGATKFEVKGALMSSHGHEGVPCPKIRRHYDIHHYGFS